MTLDWLIIGGGVHGVHIAARLLGEGGVAPERLRIVDPADRLLARWRASTATTGMTHLRSPSIHHLDVHSRSLQRFAGKRRRRKRGLFAWPYERPALTLFNAHCDHVIAGLGLDALHIEARAVACAVDSDGVVVRLSNGHEIDARRVVLALGASEQPLWPDWVPRDHPRVHHIFQPGFDGWPSCTNEMVAVIGGGISAAQVALRLNREGHRVIVISRHALRQHQFDSDPCWFGPKRMFDFMRQRDPNRRRAMISDARHRGSVPPEVARALKRAVHQEQLRWYEGAIEDVAEWGGGMCFRLSTAEIVEVDRVLLATGFAPERPGGALVDELIASASLPCASCGYPIVDPALRWHPRIHVSGPLAELELGPIARNIAGARRAGDRLIALTHAFRSAATS